MCLNTYKLYMYVIGVKRGIFLTFDHLLCLSFEILLLVFGAPHADCFQGGVGNPEHFNRSSRAWFLGLMEMKGLFRLAPELIINTQLKMFSFILGQKINFYLKLEQKIDIFLQCLALKYWNSKKDWHFLLSSIHLR